LIDDTLGNKKTDKYQNQSGDIGNQYIRDRLPDFIGPDQIHRFEGIG
jgi:hypothetical protein